MFDKELYSASTQTKYAHIKLFSSSDYEAASRVNA
jgi:hypothetical protein